MKRGMTLIFFHGTEITIIISRYNSESTLVCEFTYSTFDNIMPQKLKVLKPKNK